MAQPITPEQYAKAGTEHAHQVAVFIWAASQFERYPELRRMFTIPNGGERNKAVAGRLKAEGVKAGVPDILLPIRRGPWAGLFIELKRPKSTGKAKGRATDEQSDWITYLHTQGFGAAVCEGWEAARDMIISYLEYQP